MKVFVFQNVGSNVYDVDFSTPDDAMASLRRNGLMIRKNVVKLEMLPGPFVPLPPQYISKKRKLDSSEKKTKRRSPEQDMKQPPPMKAARAPGDITHHHPITENSQLFRPVVYV